MLSKSGQYAMSAMLYIGSKTESNRAIGLLEIAKAKKIPSHFLSKILQQLVKGKVLKSVKGPNGGFWLIKDPKKATLRKALTIVDGEDKFRQCICRDRACTDKKPCPVRLQYNFAMDKMDKILDTPLAVYNRQIKNEKCFI